MRPSEIRVWSLIWPRRASLGSVRTVSTASARADLLAATTASAADRARLNAISSRRRWRRAPPATRTRHRFRCVPAGCSAIGVDALRHVAGAVDPLDPLGDGRPRLRGGLRPDDEAEMPCADEVFVDIGLRGGALDAAHRGRLADVVDLADDGQHRAVDVGQRDQVAVDGEAAGHHPVVRDELLEQFGDRRARTRRSNPRRPGTAAAARGAAAPRGRAAGAGSPAATARS